MEEIPQGRREPEEGFVGAGAYGGTRLPFSAVYGQPPSGFCARRLVFGVRHTGAAYQGQQAISVPGLPAVAERTSAAAHSDRCVAAMMMGAFFPVSSEPMQFPSGSRATTEGGHGEARAQAGA